MKPLHLTVLGGANLDILGQSDRPLVLRDSNCGRVTVRPGGVGHNIAARLAGRGHQVALLTALGAGSIADIMETLCRREGVDLSHALHFDCPASTYLCLHDADGDMHCAINCMEPMEHLTPEALSPLLLLAQEADFCVADTNPRSDTLAFFLENVTVPALVDPVSTFKAQRLMPLLQHVYAVKPNLMEAQSMTDEKRPEDAAHALLEKGVQKVFISLGKDGVYYADASACGYMPALPLPAGAPLTGAGDALCAGLVEGLSQRLPMAACAELGVRCAHDALCANLQSI